jgi:hypothetical protein
MKPRSPSRRRALLSAFAPGLVSLWRRCPPTDWILDQMRDWKSSPKDRPMFPKMQPTFETLESSSYINEPFNILQAPVHPENAILAGGGPATCRFGKLAGLGFGIVKRWEGAAERLWRSSKYR